MNLVAVIEFLRKRLRRVTVLCLAAMLALVAFDAVPGLVDKEHAHTAVERFPAFWALFGLIGCVVLILASKAFGHAGIMTREDYYDE